MRQARFCTLIPIFALLVGAVSGCTDERPVHAVYEQERFATASPYSRDYVAAAAATCEAARRALLSQGYIIGEAKPDFVDGRKSFQPENDIHVEIEFHVVCAADGKGGDQTTAFANALQDRFALKKTNSSASVGVGAFGAVSLPFISSDDSMVKIASETIHAAEFYDRFFELIQHFLPAISIPPPAASDHKSGTASAVSAGH